VRHGMGSLCASDCVRFMRDARMITGRRKFLRLLLGTTVLSGLSSRLQAHADTYTYDALGRLKTVTYADGKVTTYTYDAADNRTSVVTTAPGNVGASLVASPSSITSGSPTTLSWTTTNATGVSINNGVGAVSPIAAGNVSVSPTVTTTYTLTATGTGGPVTASATVTVTAPSSFNQTIQITGTGPVNLRTLANNAGYNGAQNATITFVVGSGVTITGSPGVPNGGIAIDSGTWPTGSYAIALTLVVQNTAIVRGGGGSGGSGGSANDGLPGGAGGDAIHCRLPMTVTFNTGSQARAGGGGGGGGGAASDMALPDPQDFGGCGGGGGAPNGPGGDGGSGIGGTGSAGSAGTTSGGGAGGVGGSGAGAHPAGGAGGGYGATGSTGTGFFALGTVGGTGGAAGYCVRKNGHVVTVTNNGTTSGLIG
jgi:YD repeat-containing protein